MVRPSVVFYCREQFGPRNHFLLLQRHDLRLELAAGDVDGAGDVAAHGCLAPDAELGPIYARFDRNAGPAPVRARASLRCGKRARGKSRLPRVPLRAAGAASGGRSGPALTVRRFTVTSSPIVPLPRVAPLTRTLFS